MILFALGFFSGVISLYLISKTYCFINSKEWKRFELRYLSLKRKK